MITEIFTLCDFAQDANGKLNILGTFDSIAASKFPVTHGLFSIALKVRFAENECGDHKLLLKIINADNSVANEINGNITINRPVGGVDYSSFQFVANFNGFVFKEKGKYKFELFIDDEWISGITLHVLPQVINS